MLLYTTSEERLLPYRSFWHNFVIIQSCVFFVTMCYGLTESIGDNVQMGRDLAFIIGVRKSSSVLKHIISYKSPFFQIFYIIFKIVYFLRYGDALDEVVNDLEKFHPWAQKGPFTVDYRTGKRWYFLMSFFVSTSWALFLVIFIGLLITSPMWVQQQTLPFHAAFPFQWHDRSTHPFTHGIIYLFQCYFGTYALTWLLCMEGLSVCVYVEITFAIEILCLELRYLHQRCDGNEQLRLETNRLVKFHQKIVE